ncbi:MAG: hypothetical protein V4568_18735 [Pseudomonadota bacterium]
MRYLLISTAAFLILAGNALAAFAQQTLSDPTRPSTAVTGVPVTTAGSEVETGLQSIILPKGGKPMAIINGRHVTVGEKIGDEKVTKITESGIVLEGSKGVRTMKIVPNVEKTPSVKKDGAKQRGGRLE